MKTMFAVAAALVMIGGHARGDRLSDMKREMFDPVVQIHSPSGTSETIGSWRRDREIRLRT